MKCQVCNSESGKYPLCRACNAQREKGDIVKCEKCKKWHKKELDCTILPPCSPLSDSKDYIYDPKASLLGNLEKSFFEAIKTTLPDGYHIFPQINLASIIEKKDNSRWRNELFRNVDFLITDSLYSPKIIIEINDQTHLTQDRKERDKKVQQICEEAGIPIINFWSSYGINTDYISKRITETLSSLPIERIHHFNNKNTDTGQDITSIENVAPPATPQNNKKKKKGCYIATCVYGSYDNPNVRVLRRFRDYTLASTWAGSLFIKLYYTISPMLVKLFGNNKYFHKFCKIILTRIVNHLQNNGFNNSPYCDIDL